MHISVEALNAACEAAVVTVGTWEWDFASGELTWSDGLRKLLNVDASTSPSIELFLSRVHPNDRKRCEIAIADGRRTGRPINVHFRVAPTATSVRWLANKAEVFSSPSGQLTWAAGTIFDFTEIREAQLAIERREQQYRALARDHTLGEWAATPQGQITRANFWRGFTGRTRRQDICGLAWMDAVHPGDRAHLAAWWHDTLRLGCASELTFRVMHRLGEHRWIHVKAAPIFDEDRIIEWVGSARDVQNARDTEETLRVMDKHIHLAISAAKMVTWDYDLSTGFVRRSRNSENLLGMASCHIHEMASWVHPKDVDVVLAGLRRTAETGQEYLLEYRLLRREGEPVKWIRAHGKLHRGGLAGNDRIIGISIDITKEKRAEEEAADASRELAKAERRVAALRRVAGDIHWTAKPDGRVTDIPSWRAFTGQRPDEVEGWGWISALHPADRERVRNSVQAQSHAVSYGEIEYRIRENTGRYEWFITRAAPIVEDGGEPMEWVGACTRMRAPPSAACVATWGDPIRADTCLTLSGAQFRAARALLKWSVQDLSERSGVSISTVRRVEDDVGNPQNREKRMVQKLQVTLEDAGVRFGLIDGGAWASG